MKRSSACFMQLKTSLSFCWLNQHISKRCKHFRVACASGFWGDTAVSTPQLLKSTPKVDFIVYDYLSEITMSLLARAKSKDPKMGFCQDFLSVHMFPYLGVLKSQGIRIVSNAGGLNPVHCAAALHHAAKEKGLKLNVAAVTGDDLIENKDVHDLLKCQFDNIPSENIVSMNAYLGAAPIKKALDLGADIVITGRCVDSALVLGPLMHEYDWSLDQYDKLAAGSLAGHLVECGAQVTGGIFTDWESVENWVQIGFPIAEFDGDGSKFLITKPENTGGKVSFGTVAEQLVYEIGDPARYLLPDVTCNFSNVELLEISGADNLVEASGAKGLAPVATHKVTATYMDGYRATAVCPVIGGKSAKKGKATATAILKRCTSIFNSMKLPDFRRTNVQVIGAGEITGQKVDPCTECVVWLAAEHTSKNAMTIFAREIAPAGTGMAPGLTAIAGGRPTVSPVLKHISLSIPKDRISAQIVMNGQIVYELSSKEINPLSQLGSNEDVKQTLFDDLSHQPKHLVELKGLPRKLEDIAYARSGDKGDTVNIGVVARDKKYYPFLKERLTERFVSDYFAQFMADKSKIKRYELPGIGGLNFVLENSLGGGGIASLRCDPQGKAFAQMLLDCKV